MKNKWLSNLEAFVKGTIVIRLHGGNTERFLNLCEHQAIQLRELQLRNSHCEAMMPAGDFKRLLPVFRKTGQRPVIIKKMGLPFLLRKRRKQKILLFCAILFAGMLYYLSGFLWRIEFEGCYSHTREQMNRFLAENMIYEGVHKRNVRCPEIEEIIRKEFPDIGWVSAELNGTVMKIRIQETRMPVLSTEKIVDGCGREWKESYGHMVAACDGIVTKLTVSSGKALVREGEVVRKGDVLISGIVDVIGDNELLVERYPVLAQGEIILKISEKYEDCFSADYEKKEYGKEKLQSMKLYAFGQKIFSYSASNSDRDCDIITEMEQYCIGTSFYLPIKLSRTIRKEYRTFPCVYTEEEACRIADQRLMRYLSQRKLAGATLLSAEKNTELQGGSYCTEASLVFLDTAWQYRTVNPEEWRLSETNEYNPDGN